MTFSFRPPAGTPAGVLKADPLATPPNPLTVYLAPNDEFAFSLSAVGTVGAAAANGPAFGVSPNPMNFSVAVNDQTGALLTITNSGNAPLNITSYTFGSSHAFGYGSDCIGTIQPGANCTQNVTFHPSSVGTVTDSFVIHDDRDVPALQQTVTLIGVGLGPAVSLDGATCPLTAGTSCETLRMFATGTSGGTTSPVQTVTLKNTGTADLHIYNVQVNGSSTGFSKVNDTCLGQTISGQGGTCSLQFTFNASVVGPSQTTVTITDDATPTTQTITLLGGITGPAIIVTPNTNFTFSANVNQKVSTNITLTNVGSVDIAIQNIKLATNENGFSLGDLTSCFSPALGAAGNAGQLGGSCTFPVNFDPASAGSFTNSIVITTNPSLPVTITLTGAAVAGFTAPPQQFCQAGVCVTMRAYRDGSAPAATDPVDGASGQFYEDDLDLSLGGPLNLQFARFYGSGLSSGAFQSSLGVNWMSNFDVTMALNNNTAQVLLFRGKTVNFSNAGGTWTLVSPADIGYQFAAAGSGYQFMSPVSGLVYIGKVGRHCRPEGQCPDGYPGPQWTHVDLGRPRQNPDPDLLRRQSRQRAGPGRALRLLLLYRRQPHLVHRRSEEDHPVHLHHRGAVCRLDDQEATSGGQHSHHPDLRWFRKGDRSDRWQRQCFADRLRWRRRHHHHRRTGRRHPARQQCQRRSR
jgi:hypothetical protein